MKYIPTPAPPVPPANNIHLGENAQKFLFYASFSSSAAFF